MFLSLFMSFKGTINILGTKKVEKWNKGICTCHGRNNNVFTTRCRTVRVQCDVRVHLSSLTLVTILERSPTFLTRVYRNFRTVTPSLKNQIYSSPNDREPRSIAISIARKYVNSSKVPRLSKKETRFRLFSIRAWLSPRSFPEHDTLTAHGCVVAFMEHRNYETPKFNLQLWRAVKVKFIARPLCSRRGLWIYQILLARFTITPGSLIYSSSRWRRRSIVRQTIRRSTRVP